MNEVPIANPPTPLRQVVRGMRLLRLGLLVVSVASAAAIAILKPRPQPLPRYGAVPDFQLVGADNQPFGTKQLDGKIWVADFIFTTCPEVCPLMTEHMNHLQTWLLNQHLGDKVHLVSISVDPARDTPAVLAQYVAAFSPRLLGLSGTPQQIAQIEQEYHIYAAPRRTGPKPDDYTVDHSSALYLMGPDGSFVAKLPADAPPAELAAALAKRLS